MIPSVIETTSWIIGISFLAAILEPISLPFGDAEIKIISPHIDEIAEAHAPPSKILKQSPFAEITFSTPFIFAASVAPTPFGQITVELEPILAAAPISWYVVG